MTFSIYICQCFLYNCTAWQATRPTETPTRPRMFYFFIAKNIAKISIHSFILNFYNGITGFISASFSFCSSSLPCLSAIISNAEVTNHVNSNLTACPTITPFSLYISMLHSLVDVQCIYCTAVMLAETCSN